MSRFEEIIKTYGTVFHDDVERSLVFEISVEFDNKLNGDLSQKVDIFQLLLASFEFDLLYRDSYRTK